MRVHARNSTAMRPVYAEIRGPDGSRYQSWRDNLGDRWLARYGFDATGTPFEVAAHRRKMKNARKRERQEARR